MKIIDDACGRYTLYHDAETLADRYNLVTMPADIRPNYNVAPGQIMPVVTEAEDGGRHLEPMRWGLVPFWAKDPKIGYRLINARADTVFDKPIWRSVILKKRALIPTDGFYEWQRPADPKQPKQPFYIHPKQLPIFSFAGVWEAWKDVEGKVWQTYSIVTTSPNREMAKVHNRMPVILQPQDEAVWLDPAKQKREDIEPLLQPYADKGLKIYKVGTEVNSTANNDAHLIQALA